MEVVAVDLGGTHVRFAVASLTRGRVAELGPEVTLHTADYPSLASAWAAYAGQAGRVLPRAAALAVACPINGELLKLTNSPWILRPATLAAELGVEQLTLVNDFGAVGHAVAQLPDRFMARVAGPDVTLPATGVIGIIGPGTGLGVAHVLRDADDYRVMETEGGHIDFAPIDAIEDALLASLRARFRRVSAERIVSGPGLAAIYEHLSAMEGRMVRAPDAPLLWASALDGSDTVAALALQRFCMCLGSIAGDIALAQGAHGMVVGGGIGARLGGVLPASGFSARFTAKGRMEAMLATIPVKLITHPQPGLFGAAAAFAKAHAS
jgi:glucokinase